MMSSSKAFSCCIRVSIIAGVASIVSMKFSSDALGGIPLISDASPVPDTSLVPEIVTNILPNPSTLNPTISVPGSKSRLVTGSAS